MKFKLEEIAGGAIAERIESAVNTVYENIADINTAPDKARKLVVEFTFKPNKEDREMVAVSAVVKANLQPRTPVATTIIVENTNEGVKAQEIQRSEFKGQQILEIEQEAPAGVIDLQKAR